MAPHSSTFAWKISWMEEPGRLQSMGLLKVGYVTVSTVSPSISHDVMGPDAMILDF